MDKTLDSIITGLDELFERHRRNLTMKERDLFCSGLSIIKAYKHEKEYRLKEASKDPTITECLEISTNRKSIDESSNPAHARYLSVMTKLVTCELMAEAVLTSEEIMPSLLYTLAITHEDCGVDEDVYVDRFYIPKRFAKYSSDPIEE